jgi:hypothetical protein
MKLIIIAIALLLVLAFAATLAQAISMPAVQNRLTSPESISPIRTPTPEPQLEFQSPLATPTFRINYVGKELVLTQEARYVIEVGATRSAIATLTWTSTPTRTLTPVPLVSGTAVPAP